MQTRNSPPGWAGAARDLAAGAAAAAVLALAAACIPAMEPGPLLPPPASAPDVVVDRRLGSPTVVRSVPQNTPQGVRNILDATLEVVYATLPVPLDTARSGPQALRAYRLVSARTTPFSRDSTVFDTTAFPGPTFEVSPGDSVRIRLVNSLPRGPANDSCQAYPASSDTVPRPDTMQGCFHGPNFTNIHYHGFHVTPDSTGDDVLLQIAPGTRYQYAFGIPWNQSPGTHWYHPHKHGSVALQVINGMSGAFIVRGGGLDSLTERLRMRDQLIAIQTVDSAVNLAAGGFMKRVVLVNGRYRPVIQMYPNEVMRWRIVNENVNSTNQFQIGFISEDPARPGPAVFEVARDGVQYSPANYDTIPDTAVLMAPGNRLDLFVRAPRDPGVHHLSADPVADENPARRSRRDTLSLRVGGFAPTDTLFTIEVIPGPPQNATLPRTLPPLPRFLANLPGPIRADSLVRDTSLPVIVFLDEGYTAKSLTRPTQFFLGSAQDPHQRFNDTVVYHPVTAANRQRPMLLDSVQTWRVENHGISTNHPFHIHINPFQVLYVHAPNPSDPNAGLYARLNAAAQQGRAPIWMDVVPLPLPASTTAPSADPGYVIIRQRYDDFAGQYVMHCHILGHEERGMMQLLQVFRTAEEVTNRARGHGHDH